MSASQRAFRKDGRYQCHLGGSGEQGPPPSAWQDPLVLWRFFFNSPSDRPRAESRGEPRDKTRRNHKTASMHRIFRRKRQRQRREKNGEMRHNGHTNTSNATRGLRDLFHGGFSRGANAGKRGVAACPRAQARSTCRALSHRRRRVCAGSAAVSPPAGRGA